MLYPQSRIYVVALGVGLVPIAAMVVSGTFASPDRC